MTKGNLVTLKAHFIEPKFAWGTYCTITVVLLDKSSLHMDTCLWNLISIEAFIEMTLSQICQASFIPEPVCSNESPKKRTFILVVFTRWQFTFLVFKVRSHDGISNTCNLQILESCSTLKSPFNLQQKQQNTCLFSLFAYQKRDFCTTEETRMSTIKKQSRLAKSLLHSVILKDNSMSYPPPIPAPFI